MRSAPATLTFGKGGFVDQGISLDELNAGDWNRHAARFGITDRSGATAVIDLSYARTVDDVLAAINENTNINVTATAVGDTFKLTDNSGGIGQSQSAGSGRRHDGGRLGFAGDRCGRIDGNGQPTSSRCTPDTALAFSTMARACSFAAATT